MTGMFEPTAPAGGMYECPAHTRPKNTKAARLAAVAEGVYAARTDRLLDDLFLQALADLYGVSASLCYDVVAAVQWAAFPDHYAPPDDRAGEDERRRQQFLAMCRRRRIVPAGLPERVGAEHLTALVAKLKGAT